jgi:4-hydroxybenzoate polyprenyltransferase
MVVAALFFLQSRSIRDRSPAACFKAFLRNNRVGGCIFIGLAGHFLFT